MQKITYNMVKKWLNESELAKELEFTIRCYSGFYHLTDDKSIDMVAKYPSEIWELWNVFKMGYYIGLNKNKK